MSALQVQDQRAALIAQLVQRYNAADDPKEIAADHKLSRDELYLLLKHAPGRITRKEHLALRRRRLTAIVVPQYKNGASIRAIAAATGKSYGLVHRLLVLAGVTLRARGGKYPHRVGANR